MYEWTEDFVIKYLWSAAGYVLIAVPVLFTRRHRKDSAAGLEEPKADEAIAGRTESACDVVRLRRFVTHAAIKITFLTGDFSSLLQMLEVV